MSKTYRELIESLNLEEYDKQQEISNAAKSSAKHDHKIGDWTVSTSTHAASQAYLRRPEFTRDHWRALHQSVISHIEKHGIKASSAENVYYKKTGILDKGQQGYVAQVRPGKHLRIITTLDRGTSRAMKSGTEKHMVESEDSFYPIIFLD